MKKARMISLGILALAILTSVDLGLNYLNATFTELNDGIVCTSIFKILFNDSWSLLYFFKVFSVSLWVTLFVALINIVLACKKIAADR